MAAKNAQVVTRAQQQRELSLGCRGGQAMDYYNHVPLFIHPWASAHTRAWNKSGHQKKSQGWGAFFFFCQKEAWQWQKLGALFSVFSASLVLDKCLSWCYYTLHLIVLSICLQRKISFFVPTLFFLVSVNSDCVSF